MRKLGSIRDVARETGLSTATVSRVMNGASNVSVKTRQKVLNACKKLDYVPNPAARALSTNRTRTIAAIIPTIEHSVFAKYVAAIEESLDERNYSLVLAISNADASQELEAARKLLGMGADAFILSGADHDKELVKLFNRRRIPYVFTSVWDPKCKNPTIGYDNHALARNAVEYLASHGHTKIAVVHGPISESDRTTARINGALDPENILDSKDFFECELTVAGGKKATLEMLATGSGYTAVLCFSDVLAQGVYFALQEASLKVPDDISVMGFDNLDWSGEVYPSLTTINLPAKRMGRVVASQLVDHLENGQPIRHTQLTGEIIERNSIKQI